MLRSVVEPEPDFLAGAGAGEKTPAPDCCYVTKGYCGGKVVTILIKFSHILTIYTQIERENGYTFKKAKYIFWFSKLHFLLNFLVKTILVIRSRSR